MSVSSLLTTVLLVTTSIYATAGVEGVVLERPSRGLLNLPSIEDIKASCKTSASASVFLVSPGRATVKSRSSCRAFASSINAIEKIAEEYFKLIDRKPRAQCTVKKVEKIISLCAQSIAKVYTEASVDIEVLGDAVACGNAKSEGDAYAKSYAALLVNLWLGITTGENTAEADAQVGTLTFALAKAWAAAKVSKCQRGTGRVRDFESSIAEQVRVAVTCVIVELTAKLCETKSRGQSSGECGSCASGELNGFLADTESKAEIGVCSNTYTLIDRAEGVASTGKDVEIRVCKGKKDRCCHAFYNGKSECLCGRKCFMKRTDTGLWRHSDDQSLCHCPDYDALPFEKRD